jgi:hypothetical protein
MAWFSDRNYDILAAVFSDALKFMHDDLGLSGNSKDDDTIDGAGDK